MPDDSEKMFGSLFLSMATFLSAKKTTEHPVALILNDLKGNTLISGIVEYFESETEGQPGNWGYSITFNKDDIPADAVIIDMNESQAFKECANNILAHKYNATFGSSLYITKMYIIAAETLINWLNENTTEAAGAELELEKIFIANGAVEKGKKVISIEPTAEVKFIIKDDASIQK